jgi:NAD(P)H dehydrogenase (quinone)
MTVNETTTQTMQAVWYERQGDAQTVLQYGEMSVPAPGAGEVRVKLHASAVNPSDTKTRSGWGGITMPFPRVIPHNDGAGVIDSVGEGVPTSRIGERVWLYETQRIRGLGTAAQYTVVPSENAIRLPDNTRFDQGACLGVPAMTAHRGKVGGEVVRQLVEATDCNVVAAVRSPTQVQAFQEQGIDSVILDLDDPDTIAPALQNINRALLLTGYTVDMLRQSKRFLDAAQQAGVQHIVHIGASTAPTNEVAHWGWHQFVEAYIEKLGFSYTHLRPEAFMQNIAGPGYRWLNGNVIHHYVGDARWSWVDADDLALMAACVLRDDRYAGQTIPLGYDAKTFDEIAQILTEIVGQPFYAEAHPPKEFLVRILQEGVEGIYPNAYMNCVYTQFELNAAGKIPAADATFDNFEAITGRKPTDWRAFAQKHRDLLTNYDGAIVMS